MNISIIMTQIRITYGRLWQDNYEVVIGHPLIY